MALTLTAQQMPGEEEGGGKAGQPSQAGGASR
jgi:hypothetical protein